MTGEETLDNDEVYLEEPLEVYPRGHQEVRSVPGATVKIPSRVRDRLKALARGSSKTMGRVLEEAVTCYERNLRADRYLEGWTRFQRDEPEAFADYLRESEEIQATFTDAAPE